MVAEQASGRTPMKWTDLHGGHVARMKKCISAETVNKRDLPMLAAMPPHFGFQTGSNDSCLWNPQVSLWAPRKLAEKIE